MGLGATWVVTHGSQRPRQHRHAHQHRYADRQPTFSCVSGTYSDENVGDLAAVHTGPQLSCVGNARRNGDLARDLALGGTLAATRLPQSASHASDHSAATVQGFLMMVPRPEHLRQVLAICAVSAVRETVPHTTIHHRTPYITGQGQTCMAPTLKVSWPEPWHAGQRVVPEPLAAPDPLDNQRRQHSNAAGAVS